MIQIIRNENPNGFIFYSICIFAYWKEYLIHCLDFLLKPFDKILLKIRTARKLYSTGLNHAGGVEVRDNFIRGGRKRESERVDLPKVQLSACALSRSLFFGAVDLHRAGQKLLGLGLICDG